MLSSSQLNPADSNTSGRKYLGIFSQLHSRLKETAPMVFTVRLTPNKKKKKGSPGTTRLTGGAHASCCCVLLWGDYYPPPQNSLSFETKLRENKTAFRWSQRDGISRLKLVERLSSVCNSAESTPRSGY